MVYALADCNNFFCSCERAFRPDLQGKPVVVLSNNDGCIVARSNESKALGLKMGDPYFKVRELLEREGVTVFSSNYALYADMSARVMGMLRRCAPSIDIYSIDEAFLDMSGMGTMAEVGERCRRLAAEVRRGTGIPISIGVARTKTLAKVASRFAKRHAGYRGACVIDSEEQRRRALELTQVADVWGIGRRHEARLQAMGVSTALAFTELEEGVVRRLFHVTGLRTWLELRGRSCISIDELPHRLSICTSRSFAGEGIASLAKMEEAVGDFASQCVRKLRRQGTVAGAFTLFAHTSPFRTDLPQHYIYSTMRPEQPTACLTEVTRQVMRALRSQWVADGVHYYKKAGVVMWDICRAEESAPSLFDAANHARALAVQEVIDTVNRRNGHNTLRTAVQGAPEERRGMKADFLSRNFTTDIREVITLH